MKNHDGVVTHLEPDILEHEVKWTLGSITTNKTSGGDKIPVEFTQYANKFGKLSRGHRVGKGRFSFQSQRRAMSNNAETIAQLQRFHMLSR